MHKIPCNYAIEGSLDDDSSADLTTAPGISFMAGILKIALIFFLCKLVERHKNALHEMLLMLFLEMADISLIIIFEVETSSPNERDHSSATTGMHSQLFAGEMT